MSFPGLGIDANTSNAGNTTAALFGIPEIFTVDARLKVTTPNNTVEEIKYSSSSESQMVSFDDSGLEIDNNNAQTTPTLTRSAILLKRCSVSTVFLFLSIIHILILDFELLDLAPQRQPAKL